MILGAIFLSGCDQQPVGISLLPSFPTSQSNVPPQQPPPIVPTPPPTETSFCTSFDYTRWSHCATDGTQSRIITAAYPAGCTLKEGTSVEQQQECKYSSRNLSDGDIVNKMVGQIRNAPDQTITTKYFSGHPGDFYITTLKWKLSTDGTTLFLETTSKSLVTGTITNPIILADTNKDFIPDTYSNDGDHWPSIASQGSTFMQNSTNIWGAAMSYFEAYLLQ